MATLLGTVLVAPVAGAGPAVLTAEERFFDLGEPTWMIDFADPADGSSFWVEGNPERVRVDGGFLVLDANDETESVLTVFLDREVGGNFAFIYEAEVRASNTAQGFPEPRNVNNLNTLLLVSDPAGRGLREGAGDRRDGAYRHYHELNGYIVTFLNGYMAAARENPDEPGLPPDTGRIRLRENPGFHLRREALAEKSESGRLYRLQFVYYEGELLFFIDDVFQAGFIASPARRFERGHLGFRTFATEIAIRRCEVRLVRLSTLSP